MSFGDTAKDGIAITPHDSNELARHAEAIYCGVTGDIVLITDDGTTLTFKNVPTGSILPIRAAIVKATGTTATELIALFSGSDNLV